MQVDWGEEKGRGGEGGRGGGKEEEGGRGGEDGKRSEREEESECGAYIYIRILTGLPGCGR